MISFSKGFNLVEILVVLVILAILASVATAYYRSSIAESHINGIFTLASDHVNRIQSFYTQKKSYPATLATVGIDSALVPSANTNITKLEWNPALPIPKLMYYVNNQNLGLDTNSPFTIAFIFGGVGDFVAATCKLCGDSKFLPYLPPECTVVSTKADCS